MTTRLPLLLENIHIAAPCPADWDEMTGDDRARFCGGCEKNVYNLSAMTRSEAEALLHEKEGRVCVRFYQRRDGTVMTADCPVGVERLRFRQRVWARVSAVAASAALVLGLVSGRARADLTVRDGSKQVTQPHPVAMGGAVALPPEKLMGKVALPPEPKPPKKPPATMGEPMPMMGDVAATQ